MRKTFSSLTIDTEKKETGLSEHEIKDNIKNILSVYQDLKEVDIKEKEDSFTKLYSIIDHNQTEINTVENIEKIIKVYKKEVDIQNIYIDAIKELELENQLYIPEIIDHGILFVEKEKEEKEEKELLLRSQHDIEFVKSFGKIESTIRQARPVGIGNIKNPLLKRYFFKNNGKEDNGKEHDINNIIFKDGESYGLFYFIQMKRVHDELHEDYKPWNKFEWDNKPTCISKLNEYKEIHQQLIDKTAVKDDKGNMGHQGYTHNDVNSSNIFVKKGSDETYKYALIDFGEASEGLVEKYTFNCNHIDPDIDSITEKISELELGGKKKTKKKRIINKHKTHKGKNTQTNRNKNKKNRTKKKFLYNPDDPKKSFDVYIDKDPTDTIPIKYTTIDDVKTTIETLEKLYKQNKYPHKRIWQVGMIMKVRIEAMLKHKNSLYPNAKNVKKRFDLANKYFLFLRSRTKEKDEKKRKEMKFKT